MRGEKKQQRNTRAHGTYSQSARQQTGGARAGWSPGWCGAFKATKPHPQQRDKSHCARQHLKKRKKEGKKKSKMKRRASACVRARVCWISHCTPQNTNRTHTRTHVSQRRLDGDGGDGVHLLASISRVFHFNPGEHCFLSLGI